MLSSLRKGKTLILNVSVTVYSFEVICLYNNLYDEGILDTKVMFVKMVIINGEKLNLKLTNEKQFETKSAFT